MEGSRTKLTDVNPHLVCVLCHGYFVDATTIAECLHSFCRSCIFRQLERKSICPICEVQVHNTKLHLSLRLDKTLQDIVYKLVPGLFRNEMQRRRDFYKNHPYRDEHLDPESRGVGLDRLIYSPDDLISLSLEFYDEELEREEWSNNNNNSPKPNPEKEVARGTKRYLQCPAGFKMAHLKKFIRQKYGLPPNCNVEIMYRRESLPDTYSLMDIAYIYTWKRNGPMRFYYRMPDFVHKQILPPLDEKAKDEKVTTPVAAEESTVSDVETPKSKENGTTPTVAEEKEPPGEKFQDKPIPEVKPEPKVQPTNDELPPLKVNGEPKRDETEVVSKESTPAKPEEKKNCLENTLPNGLVTTRPLSKQDELSVSVLLSLGNCRVDEKQPSLDKPKPPEEQKEPEPEFTFPKPFCYAKAPNTPRPGTEHYNKKILNGKLNPKFSVNNIASELAKNNRLNSGKKILPWQRPELLKKNHRNEQYIKPKPSEKSDPFAFPVNDAVRSSNSSPLQHSTQYKPLAQKTPEPTVPPLKISLSKGNPRVDPSSLPTALPKPKVAPSGNNSPSSSQNGYSVNPERPEVTVKTTNGSLTITTQPPVAQNGSRSPQQPDPHRKSTATPPNIRRVNGGGGLTIVPEIKPKENTVPSQNSVNTTHRLPTFPKPPVRKSTFMPGGVISKTGPTLDQRIQQLYKNQNNRQPSVPNSPVVSQAQPAGKPQESRLANWLNNRFPPQQKPPTPNDQPAPKNAITPKSPKSEEKKEVKESDVAKLSKEMCMLKRKLDELRNAQNACEITQENPGPEIAKKRRDVTPDVSIEFMRASDMKKVEVAVKTKEKTTVKRPVPALKAIQEIDVSKRKNVEDDKGPAKKAKLAVKKEEEALDLSGAGAGKPGVDLAHRMALIHQNGRLPPPEPALHWMLNRPLLANQHFIPRST
ncbi:polycomb group protein Psc-like [Cimex lectularius]|uniref:RING-type domain-containing protein n=1 Tax=Cimex lectularius TaxID=79782 RepID=A0A8I6S0A2_CIMLE|nr:polycomb group protein Psc-like [Cimex lectularius]